ncbi:HEAT repeat domain-containing protein [Bacillus thuringiensis]|uniref:HEAT repeat domain-containing protein n=1 Tax=Bacillus thuringiensis TaxID=1428 RepID=A0A9X6V6U0_BACTU|nr:MULTISPECIES: HEAT repeat domain-containing protein [Bacillus]AJQ57533.1 PBS lyase [Bacillus thuringiensis serovar morrisoni]AMR83243.1 PBS lyase [Bacillus thuringiensis]EOO06604.1 PBS lyase [Bacillus cereus str. Schrouff]EOO83178.1 PBS lyase [Bacillus cereus K-5975c]KIP28099.1 HEAT repeats family protein [Bacillus thuringiensis serovar morrisoni]
MEGYIDDLLRRIADEETDIWHRAYDEAKALNDLLIFPYLQGKLSKAKKVSMKKDIYYLMTKLAINTKEICIADYLIDCLEYEDSPTLLSELLSNIYTLPVVSSTNKIIPYIYHKNDSVRYWAVASLKLYKSLEAESALLKLLDTEENKDEITHICYTLLEIGTKQSILPLTKLLYSNSVYVRSTVIEVLAKIGGSDLQIVYIEALHDRNVMVKYEAVRAIYTYGDEMAMRAICERVNKIVARRRKNEVEPTDEAEIIIALRFLHKFANHEEVLKIFDKVYKKRGNLFMSEREWLRDNITYFQEKESM